ncbi:MAG: hypothetical protein ACK55Z_01135, partial [bacterium]
MRHGNETTRGNTQRHDTAGHEVRGTTDLDRPVLHPTEAKRLSDRGIASELQAPRLRMTFQQGPDDAVNVYDSIAPI